MTKKVVTSLLLSTALLPMLSGKADTASANQKPAAATKGNSAASAASQQVTLSAGSQTETTAAGATDQSVASDGAKTDDQAESTSTTTATTSATSRVTVRAASQAAKADSTGPQSQSSASEAAKDNAAASATADSTTSAVDQLDKTAKASAATSQASHSTTNETAKASAAASQDSHVTTDQSSVTVTSEVAKSAASSAAPKQATEQAVAAKISPKIETAVAADAVQSSAMMARSTRAMTSQEIFLSQIKAGAISGWNKYQVLPSVTAAQAILESGWGQSQLATQGNNLFGIKGSYQGQSIYFPTQEWNGSQYITIQDAFRKYPNWSASVEDHGAFLVVNPRYSNLIGVTDYRRVASLLQQDGYATAPTYASSLISIIEYNKLHEWDQEALSGQASGGNDNNQVQPDQDVTPTSGTHKFTKTTTIHNAPDATSAVVGTYNAGETVNYNGKLTVGNATWLRYQSYSGVSRYVMISQTTTNDNNNQATVTPASGSYKFTAKTNIRSAASKTAQVVGTYNAGDTVYYNGKVTTNGQTWLRYMSYSGAQHYVQISGESTSTNVDKPQVTPQSGSYRFTQTTAIKNTPAGNAPSVGTYSAGDTVYYNAKVTANGQTWLRYLSYSGAQHYVAISGNAATGNTTSKPVTNSQGAFRFVTTTNIRTAPSTRASVVGEYNPGETVYYNGTVQAEGYTWLRYLSRSGATHYVAKLEG